MAKNGSVSFSEKGRPPGERRPHGLPLPPGRRAAGREHQLSDSAGDASTPRKAPVAFAVLACASSQSAINGLAPRSYLAGPLIDVPKLFIKLGTEAPFSFRA